MDTPNRKAKAKTMRTTTSAQKQEKLFGKNSLELNEDAASLIVGSVLEKSGISISDSDSDSHKPALLPLPKPTLLSFPVARHRSHGPHWDPITLGKVRVDNDEDGQAVKHEDEAKSYKDSYKAAAHAKPLQRKGTKELDLSGWKDFVPIDNSSTSKKLTEEVLSSSRDQKLSNVEGEEETESEFPTDIDMIVSVEGDAMPVSSFSHPSQSSNSNHAVFDTVTDVVLDNLCPLGVQIPDACSIDKEESFRAWDQINSERMSKYDMPVSDVLVGQGQIVSSSQAPYSFKDNQNAHSLENQIDAENRARIHSMTAEEISEARAEIMEKIDPTLIRLLRKRGQQKPNKQKHECLEAVNRGELDNMEGQDSLPTENDASKTVSKVPLKHTDNGPDKENNIGQRSTINSNLWNAWCSRVEAVRKLRFSLDGTLIESGFVHSTAKSENCTCSTLASDIVTERDFLRTEGDPGAAGYTIKEAVELTRSVIPGQRTVALYLLTNVLGKALNNIFHEQVGRKGDQSKGDASSDWEAIWAFALGPAPELILSLRISLDDNHSSVVLASARAIHCVLSCELNDNYFHMLEKTATCEDIYTAPVFRSKPNVDYGFLCGGFWKYNAKPANINPFNEAAMDDDTEGNNTIQDDIVVAGQDFAAGLVRMGILPKLCFLLETGPTAALEECIISILVALARHSPQSANAIMICPGLVQKIVDRFTINTIEIRPSMIKAVILFKTLAKSDKKTCWEFIKNGYFQDLTWHLCQYTSSIDHWLKLGKEKCKILSALIVEQLRFWKVCIRNGYCISYFSDVFPAFCLWLNPPSFEKLIKNNVLDEFTSISLEAYLVLEALASRLPNFFSQKNLSNDIPNVHNGGMETWSWSYISPMVDLAVKWMKTKKDIHVVKLFEKENRADDDFVLWDQSLTSLLWVYSSVTQFLFVVLEKITPDDTSNEDNVPWLPEFVPQIGLELIRCWLSDLLVSNGTEFERFPAGNISFIKELRYLRLQVHCETSLASVFCLRGLIKLIIVIDNLIQSAKADTCGLLNQERILLGEGKVLEDGLLRGSWPELRCVLCNFSQFVMSDWYCVQSVEMFGRGGPAPGVGIGWGVSGGGYWSKSVLVAQSDAAIVALLLEILPDASGDVFLSEETINSALAVCLIAGPRDKVVIEKALDFLFCVSVLKYLDSQVHQFLTKRRMKVGEWQFEKEDYQLLSKTLAWHFKSRWLSVKERSKATERSSAFTNQISKVGQNSLETIYEDLDTSSLHNQDHAPLVIEWAHQRLPLPVHFYLSPIATVCYSKQSELKSNGVQNSFHVPNNLAEVTKFGLRFVLGIETVSYSVATRMSSPVHCVPLIWKLHSLSVNFVVGMEVLDDERSRDIFEALQDLYGEFLDEARSTNDHLEFLKFQSEIHESYSTFIEELVEQYSAISYGDLIFGRQVALYLNRCVEAPVRLAAWNALSNAFVLDLLPPIDKCFSSAEGYLYPVEDNDSVMEAYVKSWVAGAVDKAAIRGSVAYTLVVHHISSFMFKFCPTDKQMLRKKIAKSVLRDFSQKHHHKEMVVNLIYYDHASAKCMPEEKDDSFSAEGKMELRLKILADACDGNLSLLREVEKLKAIVNKGPP